MMRIGVILLMLLVAGCDPGSPSPVQNESVPASTDASRWLRPGLYEVTGFESLSGMRTGPERRETTCIGHTEAAHPDRFLVNPGNGCKPGELIISDHEMQREFRCQDNHVINFTVSFTSDSWHQSVIGTSTTGGYEARETGRRVGDC